VDEAIATNCNLIVSFHPIIFKGLKSITGKTYVERVVQKAIKHDIAIFAIHTALDNAFEGVNAEICNRLNLINKSILMPQSGTVKKLTTFVPTQMPRWYELHFLKLAVALLEIMNIAALTVKVLELLKEIQRHDLPSENQMN